MDDSEDWNMGKAYYQRLDAILTMCTVAHIKGNGLEWYKGLFRLYMEIESKMKPEQKDKARKMMKELTDLKNNSIKFNKPVPTEKFLEFELYMRSILEEKGMLTPKKNLEGL